jgi:hypothetical protein
VSPERFDQLAADYVDGALAPADAAELAEAVRTDAALRARLLELAGTDGLLRAAFAAPDLEAELLRRVDLCTEAAGREERTTEAVLDRIADRRPDESSRISIPARGRTFRRIGRPPGGPGLALAVAIAAAAAFLLAFTFALRPGPSPRPTPATPLAREAERAPEPIPAPPPVQRTNPLGTLQPPPAPRAPAPLLSAPPPVPAPVPAPPVQRTNPLETLQPPPAPPPPTRVAVAELSEVLGEATLVRQGVPGPARPGAPVLAGDGLVVGASARVGIAWPDGTKVLVAGDSELGSIGAEAGKRVTLGRGRLSAVVAKQPAKEPMVILSSHGEARVLGTTLHVAVGDAMRLEVEEGRVRLVRAGDGRSVDVPAGHFAVAAPRVDLVARPLPTALFADGFAAAPVGAWPAGWGRHAREAATRSGFVVRDEGAERVLAATTGGLTQHAFLPPLAWPERWEISFRMRLAGGRNDRAGIEIEDGRRDASVEFDATAGQFKIERPRGTVAARSAVRLPIGTWTQWRIAFRDGRLSASMEGLAALEIEAADYGPPTGPSLISKGADGAQFDDVKVRRLPGGPR